MSVSTEVVQEILELVRKYFEKEELYKIKVTGPLEKTNTITEISGRPVMIKDNLMIQFVNRYSTKDITKNYKLDEAIEQLKVVLSKYKNVTVQSNTLIHQLDTRKQKLFVSKKNQATKSNLNNDRKKNKVISATRPFLQKLGISSTNGKVYSDKQSKYKQINKYIELINPLIKKAKFSDTITVTDMGCGKGYLTFALYDYLVENLELPATVMGIDLREEMMKECNLAAKELGYNRLSFESSSIQDYQHKSDVLIALHACDTATDDAIISGLNANAKLIICSPCCHKQVRKDMISTETSDPIVSHGILEERLAEILTDTIRSLILEAHGYKTQIMEFISSSHTPKNLLITAIKTDGYGERAKSISKIEALKKQYGITNHYLERVFSS